MLGAFLLITLAQPVDALAVGDRFGQPESAACQPCHPRHYAEWMASVHAAPGRRLALPHGSFRPPVEEDGDFRDPTCRPCHGDTLDALLAEGRSGFPVTLGHSAERTVTCIVCHQFGEGALPEVAIDAGGRVVADRRPRGERRGRPFHTGGKPPIELERATLCGPCHEVTAPNGLALERTYSQFLSSPYPARMETCVTCHMISYGGAMVPDGIYHGLLHRHDFIGVDTAANPVPAVESQPVRVQRFLAAAATLFVRDPEAVEAGREFPLDVEVVNSGAGHNFPAGFPAERRLWIEVDVTLDDGTVLLRSGRGRAEELEGEDDPQLVDFTDRFVDDAGREVPFWWQAARIEERSLAPLERRRVSYAIDVPASALGRSLQIEVRLRFRACSPRQLRLLGMDSLLERSPVLDVHAHRSGPVPVVERLFPPDTLVVPDEVADIAEALRRIPEGGSVLVRPGTYTLERPLRFGGRRATVRSFEGPAATVLRLRPPSEGDADGGAASVVVFDAAEGPETRLEGFTITGGRGTAWGGATRGGGVFCRGASPTIAGNLITGNRAGVGGGVALVDSRAALEGNSIERNEAEERGGAIAVEGESRAVVSGGRVFANAAGDLGGGIFVGASLALDGVTVEGNRAQRGGGIALAAAGDGAASVAAATIEGCEVLGNSAPAGGGVLVSDLAARIERTVIAGNVGRLGGALSIAGSVAPELVAVTVTENSASRWGAFHCRGDARPRVRDSIIWGNAPPDIDAEASWSLVEDPAHVTGTNIDGVPYFERPGRWVACGSIDEPGCVPVRWAPGRPPRPVSYQRWVPGMYRIVDLSPAIDAADPAAPPDRDDSRRDMGAVYHQQAPRAFVRGDVDGDGRVGARDVFRLLGRLLVGDVLPCEDAADVDDRGGVGVLDLALLVVHLFDAGVEPAAPFPACGVDPTFGEGTSCFESQEGCR